MSKLEDVEIGENQQTADSVIIHSIETSKMQTLTDGGLVETTAMEQSQTTFTRDNNDTEDDEIQKIVDDTLISLEAEAVSFRTDEISVKDIGSTNRLTSTPIERWMYFSSCFSNHHEHIAWTKFKNIMTYAITSTRWLGSFVLWLAYNITSCIINCFCTMISDDKKKSNDDVCCYLSMFSFMYRATMIWMLIFCIICIFGNVGYKIFFTIAFIPVLVLNARCIWECYQYVDAYKSYPGLFYDKYGDSLEDNCINAIMQVTFSELSMELQTLKIEVGADSLQMKRLQQHAVEGIMVINIYNKDWKRMYLKYSYKVWLWFEFIFLLFVIIIAWARHN